MELKITIKKDIRQWIEENDYTIENGKIRMEGILYSKLENTLLDLNSGYSVDVSIKDGKETLKDILEQETTLVKTQKKYLLFFLDFLKHLTVNDSGKSLLKELELFNNDYNNRIESVYGAEAVFTDILRVFTNDNKHYVNNPYKFSAKLKVISNIIETLERI